MFYENWMSYIKDDAKLTKLAIPGAHNAGTKGMPFPARCQNGTIFAQYQYGVRKFGIRLSTDRKGRPRICHGLLKGMTAEQAFASLQQAVEAAAGEFLIIDVRPYGAGTQQVGPLTFRYDCDPAAVDSLVQRYLRPAQYAFTEFDDIRNVTMGDLRRSGKRYILLNANKAYRYSSDAELLEPWDAQVFGLRPEKFAKADVDYLRTMESSGFFWFQSQQTPNPGTEIGLTWPNRLDRLNRPYFPQMMREIAADPVTLEKVNIVAGDFMTADHMKVNEILYLNLCKGVVKEDLRKDYADAIGRILWN